MNLHDDLCALAAVQHGVISADQVAFAGASEHQLRTLRRGDRWDRPTRRVFRLVGAPETPLTPVMTALLDAGPGAVASHQTALAMWRVPGFELVPTHVSHPRGGVFRPETNSTVHTSRRMSPDHIVVMDGVPVTLAGRALFDLAATLHPLRVARTLDTLGAMRLVTGPSMYRLLDELRGRGRPGVQLMRDLIFERGRDWVPAESNLEIRFQHLIKEDRQEPLVKQPRIGDDEDVIGRMDFWDPTAKVNVEIDSDRYHLMPSDRAADAARDARFTRLGIQVERIREHDVWYHPTDVVQRVWDARQAGRSRHGAPLLTRRSAA